jgi:uncharacterized membrane protein YqjE
MSEPNNGLFASAKRLADLVLAAGHNRVELFAVELQEEKCRFVQAILLTAGTIALGVSALTLVTITLVLVFWDRGLVPVLCALSMLFIIGAGWLAQALRKCLLSGPGFKGTLGELRKDRACLQPPD